MQSELISTRNKMHALQEISGKEIRGLQIQLDASKQINKMASEEIQALTQKNNHQLKIFQDQEEELSDLNFCNSELEYSLSEQQDIIADLHDENYHQHHTIKHQKEENENLQQTNIDLEQVISQQRKEICDLRNHLYPDHCDGYNRHYRNGHFFR